MKNILTSTLTLLSIFGLFYMLGVFVQASFDITQWSFMGRYVIGVLGGIFAIVGAVATFIYLQTK